MLWSLGVVEHPVFTSRDGVLGAGVYDWLQQVVELCDVQLSLQQQLLGLLLNGQRNGCTDLFLSE